MKTFQKQFEALPPHARDRFTRKWGPSPWNDPAKNTLEQRKAWKAELNPQPRYPRWECIHSNDALYMALRAKNRRAAHALLDQRTDLTREEAGNLVLLTLQWAPDLLARILSLAPDRPFCWLHHEITLHREHQLRLSLQGSLVMIAAALNDLPALEILLQRGAPADYNFQRDRWDIAADLLMGGVIVGAMHSPDYSVYQVQIDTPFPEDSSRALIHADPLSAAIFCNAKRCVSRLLKEPAATVTPAVRRALAVTPCNEAQALVAEQLDTPLEELLLPEDFGPELDHPLLPAVLRRHKTLPRKQLKAILEWYSPSPDSAEHARQIEILSLLDPALLGDMVYEVWYRNNRQNDLLQLAQAMHLPLDRCRVPEQFYRDGLIPLMEHFRITGTPPEGGLSGLASSLLHLLKEQYDTPPMPVEQLLHIPGAAQVLETEDPDILIAWLEQNPDIPATQTLPLKSLLNIRKEVHYDL